MVHARLALPFPGRSVSQGENAGSVLCSSLGILKKIALLRGY
jgi:hypothetical protein